MWSSNLASCHLPPPTPEVRTTAVDVEFARINHTASLLLWSSKPLSLTSMVLDSWTARGHHSQLQAPEYRSHLNLDRDAWDWRPSVPFGPTTGEDEGHSLTYLTVQPVHKSGH
ncbi:hypothetical protein HRR83_000538 [Exophiala dermatitidis]|nr:hypothetical protein HRR74_000539 [Exophiala dermatitidis]KAJ4528420.1 hypothetical protein HRR73_001043 [Exophiala dermatitidis]KAJ4531377.1 hypothetical protein HRR76_009037 [Exophiala dermatitidis]KAJ4581427.1 hypothetical protein HRR79_000458 [Exophiala dermatitidis]KAJ4584651.1 hypothetical protein HRR81_000457 [Exophiala dermatitidis]